MKPSNLVWRIGLLVILVSGIVFFFTGYDSDLPMVEMKDERRNLDEIYVLRNLTDDSLWKPGYPPGILYVYYGAQLLVEQTTGGSALESPCLVINYVRIASIFINLLTLMAIAFLGRKLGGDLAGLAAAGAWLVAPQVLQWNQFGFPQNYEGLFYILTVYLAVLAIEHEQPRWALASTLAGLGAVFFKYTLFPTLGIGVGASLWLLRKDRKRWFKVLGLQFAAIALTAVALLTLSGVGSLAESGHRETTVFLEGGLSKLWNLSEVSRYLDQAAAQIGLSLPMMLVILVVGTIAYWLTATPWQRLSWLGAVGLVLIHPWFMAAYFKGNTFYRNLLTSSSLLTVTITVAIFAIGWWLGRRIQRPIMTVISVTGLLAIWLVPQVVAGWQWIQYRELPINSSAMVQWVHRYLPEEKLLVQDYRPFDSLWSCENYDRTSPVQGDITDKPLEEWLNKGIYYVQLTQQRVEELGSTPEGRAYLDQMTLLKQFPPPEEEGLWRKWRYGSKMDVALAVYRLWSPSPIKETDTVFGEQIRLFGYDLETPLVAPGDTLAIRFYWQPIKPPTADYHVFIHLVSDDATNILAQSDGIPARSELRPTNSWDDMDEILMSHYFEITVPDTLEPQMYRLLVGLYDWRTNERLVTDTGSTAVEIPITVIQSD